MSGVSEAEVAVLDLRGRDVTEDPLHAGLDTGRLVIVDEVARLGPRQAFYEGILGRRAVGAVLLVVVGSPRAADGRAALTLSPAFVATESAATLWVGDGPGADCAVEWDMDAGHVAPPRTDPRRSLDLLLGVLRLREVFDGVLAAACEIPNRVAAPGLRVTPGRFGDDVLAEALRKGLERLAGEAGAGPVRRAVAADLVAEDRSRNRVLALLLGDLGAPGVAEPLVPGGPLARLVERCGVANRMLVAVRGELESVGTLVGSPVDAVPRVVAAGTALRELRDGAERLFGEADGYDGADQVVRDRLVRAGVRMEPEGAAAEDPADALRVTIQGELRRGVPLRLLAARLRDYAARVAPGGSGARRERLREACPDWLLDALAAPPPFLLLPYRMWLPATAAALGFVLGLAGGPPGEPGAGPFVQALGLALLAGLVWAAGVALLHARVPEPGGPCGWAHVPPQPAAAHGALVAAGFVAGHLLWRTPPAQAVPPPPTSLAVLLWAAVLAAMALLLLGWWRWAVARWYAGLRAGAAQDAATALAAHLHTVAITEWVLAAHRRRAADTAQTYAAVLQDLADTLHDGVVAHRERLLDGIETPDPRRGGARLGEYGAELADLVAEDLFDLAGHVLAPLWQQMYGGAPADLGARVDQHARAALAGYFDHLQRRGVHERPPFSRDNPRRRELAAAVWRQSGDIAEIVRMPVGGGMVQLCGRHDLALLQGTSGSRAVRFAPRAAQPPVGGRDADLSWAPPADVVWTSTGQFAGVIRLVPLRAGIVDFTWAVEGAAEGAAEGAVDDGVGAAVEETAGQAAGDAGAVRGGGGRDVS